MEKMVDDFYKVNKIDLIKMVREITAMGLKESKDAVDSYLLMQTLNPTQQRVVYEMQALVQDRQDLKCAFATKIGLNDFIR